MVLFIEHVNGKLDKLPLEVLIFLVLLFVCGIWTVMLSLFKLDEKGALSWIVGAVVALGFAVFACLGAWRWKEGWSGGIPFIPHAWNQIIARLLFALGGLLATVMAVVFLRKAIRKHRETG
ncbi:MAG: hypothetical protein ABSC38_06170 [Verrucomicrobiia bacterium]